MEVKLTPSVKQVPLSPFPRKRAPRRLPPAGGTSRSRSAGAFPNCVTRFRGGALRHAKFPKTSYKVQLLDTRLHAACVSLNHGRRRDLIFLSKKVLVPSWAKRKRFVGLPLITASGASPQGEAEKAFSCGEGGAQGATEGEDKKALSLSHFVTAPSQMEPKSWTAA